MDRDAGDLRENARRLGADFPATRLETLTADFTRSFDLGAPLAGLVMANALHFVERRRQPDVVRTLAGLLGRAAGS